MEKITIDKAADLTRRLLLSAGIGPGMRVLDVGCGYGAVTLLLAELVGEQGQVTGVDRDAHALTVARERAEGRANVSFRERELGALRAEDGLFDAAVGRRVLMYQPDAVAAIGLVARAVRPGGLLVFQEHDSTIGPTRHDALPLHKQVRQWVWDTVEREGANVRLGFQLHAVFTRAGLAVEQVQAEAVLLTPTQHHPIADIVRAILPRILQQKVATAAEIEIDTLESRLRAEQQQAPVTCVWEMAFGIWARKPG